MFDLLLGPGKRKSLKLSTKKVTLFSNFRQLFFIFISNYAMDSC